MPMAMADVPLDRHLLLHEVFQRMDADRNGYIDPMEFKSIFSEVGEKHSDERLREIDAVRGRGNQDGRLSADEFCAFMLEYLADKGDKAFRAQIDEWQAELAKSHRKLLLRRVFARMDTDQSGGVSLEEFKALSDVEVGVENSEAYFRWMEQAQGNNDGQLTPEEWVPRVLELEAGTSDEEFEALVAGWMDILAKGRRVTLLRQVFSKMDADASGEVDTKEFVNLKEGAETDELLPMIFHYLDDMGDGDGMLSLNEWVTGMRQMGESLDDEAFEAEIAKWMELLTANQRTIWRGVFARGHAQSFVKLARAAGATHVLLVHHGNASPGSTAPDVGGSSEWKAADAERLLTNVGTAQCMVSRAEWFGRLPVRKMLLSSPARYAMETALHMSGRAGHGNAQESHEDAAAPIVIEQLHPFGAKTDATDLFQQKGFGPLRRFLDAEGGETAFGMYAEEACKELTAKFRENGKSREKETYTAIFGQAVFINTIAHAIACAAGASSENLERLLDFDLREAEAILVPLYGGPAVQHLKRPL